MNCTHPLEPQNFALDNITYAVTCNSSVAVSIASWCTTSAKAASSDCPWIMCAVEAKSGTTQKPVRRTLTFVRLFTIQVRERGVSGYTPTGKSGIWNVAPGKATQHQHAIYLLSRFFRVRRPAMDNPAPAPE